MNIFFSLPDDENNSKADCDEDAAKDLSQLRESIFSRHTSDNTYEEPETMEYTEYENGSCTDNQGVSLHDWGSNVLYFEKVQRRPSTNPKVTDDLVSEESELVYFITILSEETLKLTRDNKNLYATQEHNNRHHGVHVERSVTNNWTPTTVEEIKTHIAIHILMRVHSLAELQNYWSSDRILGVSAIADSLTKNRFKKLTENLHCK